MRATEMCDFSEWLEEGDWGKYGGRSKQGRTKVVGKRGEHSSYVTIPVTTLGHMISQQRLKPQLNLILVYFNLLTNRAHPKCF